MFYEAVVTDWLFVTVVNIIIIASIGFNVLLHHLNFSSWVTRKATHILLLAGVAIVPLFIRNLFDAFVALAIAVVIIAIFTLIPQVRILIKIIKNSTRDKEKFWELLINVILTSITVFFTFLVFQNNLYIFTAAILSLSIGDGLGEFIGRPLGKIRYTIFSEKSLEGSIGVFVGIVISIVASYAMYNVIGLLTWWEVLVVALIGTLTEAINYKFYDNISLPIIISIILFLFSY